MERVGTKQLGGHDNDNEEDTDTGYDAADGGRTGHLVLQRGQHDRRAADPAARHERHHTDRHACAEGRRWRHHPRHHHGHRRRDWQGDTQRGVGRGRTGGRLLPEDRRLLRDGDGHHRHAQSRRLGSADGPAQQREERRRDKVRLSRHAPQRRGRHWRVETAQPERQPDGRQRHQHEVRRGHGRGHHRCRRLGGIHQRHGHDDQPRLHLQVPIRHR